MTGRTIIRVLIAAAIAYAAWATVTIVRVWQERPPDGVVGAVFTPSDYQRCVRVVPPPIVMRRRGVILYPQARPEIS